MHPESSPPIRAALSLTCLALSSPVTYRVRSSGQWRGICRERVDLPIPGSPPISTSEPSTRPPPRMRSTSLLFSDMRFSTDELISASGIGLCPEPGTVISAPALFFPVATVSSTIVFHSPHAGQRPIHLGLSFPHSLQNHTLLVLTVAILEIFSVATNLPIQ